MAPWMTFHFEGDVAADVDDVGASLLDPALLVRCVPGGSLTAADDGLVTGRIRIKQAAKPSVYDLEAELGRAEGDPGDDLQGIVIAADGVAEEQRTGTRFNFRIRVALCPSDPGQSRCRIAADLPAGDETQRLFDRLTPQFIHRLEDVAREVSEISATQCHATTPQDPPPGSDSVKVVPELWAAAGRGGTVAGLSVAAALLLWVVVRRRRWAASSS